MKRIFLIGDSIRIGYDAHVREMMADEAQTPMEEYRAGLKRIARHRRRRL